MTKDNNETKSTNSDVTSLADRSHEVADEVRQATLQRVESVRASAQSVKESAAEQLRKFGATVRKVGEHMRVEDQRYIADRATDASQRLDEFANYLTSAEVSTMLRDTGTLARRNPGWFFGGALVAGLAAGRVLKGAVGGAGSGAMASGAMKDEPTTGVSRRPRNDSNADGMSSARNAEPQARPSTATARSAEPARTPAMPRTGDAARSATDPMRSGTGPRMGESQRTPTEPRMAESPRSGTGPRMGESPRSPTEPRTGEAGRGGANR